MVDDPNYDGFLVDVFALGVLLFMMATAAEPFKEATSTDVYYSNLIRGDGRIFWSKLNRLGENFKDLISKMLELDPKKRITLAGIKKHSWMLGPVESVTKVIDDL